MPPTEYVKRPFEEIAPEEVEILNPDVELVFIVLPPDLREPQAENIQMVPNVEAPHTPEQALPIDEDLSPLVADHETVESLQDEPLRHMGMGNVESVADSVTDSVLMDEVPAAVVAIAPGDSMDILYLTSNCDSEAGPDIILPPALPAEEVEIPQGAYMNLVSMAECETQRQMETAAGILLSPELSAEAASLLHDGTINANAMAKRNSNTLSMNSADDNGERMAALNTTVRLMEQGTPLELGEEMNRNLYDPVEHMQLQNSRLIRTEALQVLAMDFIHPEAQAIDGTIQRALPAESMRVPQANLATPMSPDEDNPAEIMEEIHRLLDLVDSIQFPQNPFANLTRNLNGEIDEERLVELLNQYVHAVRYMSAVQNAILNNLRLLRTLVELRLNAARMKHLQTSTGTK